MENVWSPAGNTQESAAPGDAAAQSWAAPHQTGLPLMVWDSTGTPGTADPMLLLLQLLAGCCCGSGLAGQPVSPGCSRFECILVALPEERDA